MNVLPMLSYRSCLKVRDGALVLFNQSTKEQTEWDPRRFPFDTVVADPLGGFVTFPALRWLAEEGVTVSLLDFNGWPIGTFLPDVSPNVTRRLEQTRAFLDPARRYQIAKQIVERKVGKAAPAWAMRLNDLRLWEGQEAAAYWASKGIVRSYPHARDPVNARLNYAFGLLESRVRTAIHRAGYDPAIGFLHEPQDGKSAFVYDLMEGWRDLTVSVVLPCSTGTNLKRTGYYEMFRKGWRMRPHAAARVIEVFSAAFTAEEEDEVTAWASQLVRGAPAPPRTPSGPRPTPSPPPAGSSRGPSMTARTTTA
jgi:CRISPR/Cas system-associated endonuclease Cas1